MAFALLFSIVGLSLCIYMTHSALIQCLNYRQCVSHTLQTSQDDDYYQCLGVESCWNAHVASFGVLDCSGLRSCIQASSLYSRGNMYCDGFKSCYDIQAINAPNFISDANISCGSTWSCSSSDRAMVADNIFCSGYEACTYMSVTAKYMIIANSYHSIEHAIMEAKSIYLNGYWAAYNSEINTNLLVIRGYGAAAHSNIYAYDDGSSPRSLKVECYGIYGTFSATMYCKAQDTCELLCWDNCCQHMTLEKEHGATVTVDCDTYRPCPAQSIVPVGSIANTRENNKQDRKDRVKDLSKIEEEHWRRGGGHEEEPFPENKQVYKYVPDEEPDWFGVSKDQWTYILGVMLMISLSVNLSMQYGTFKSAKNDV